MHLLAAGALAVSLAAGQVQGEPVRDGAGAGAGDGSAERPNHPAEPDAAATTASASGTVAGRSADVRPILDLSLGATTRVGQYVTPGTPSESNRQVEADAMVSVTARHQVLAFRGSYSARFLDVTSGSGAGKYLTQGLFLGTDVPADPRWLLTFTAGGTYGTQSSLAPAGAPPGTQPGVPVSPTPFPRATSLESWSAEARAGAAGRLSPVSTLRFLASASATSGIGDVDRLSLPPQATVRLEAGYEVRLSSRDELATSGYAHGTRLQQTLVLPGGNVTSLSDTFVAAIVESWRQRPGPRTEIALGLGGAWANVEATTFFSHNRLMPVAELRVGQDVALDAGLAAVPSERSGASRLRLAATLAYAPYIDPMSAFVYDRLTASAAATWPFHADWSANATLSTAVVPDRGTIVQRYGGAEAGLTYSPLRFATFQAGFFWNHQAGSAAVTTFQAWGASFAIALHDVFHL